MASIKEQREEIQSEMQKLQERLKLLQQECKHPAFEKGYSMMGCVQPVLFCTECGHMRPLVSDQNESDGQQWLI